MNARAHLSRSDTRALEQLQDEYLRMVAEGNPRAEKLARDADKIRKKAKKKGKDK